MRLALSVTRKTDFLATRTNYEEHFNLAQQFRRKGCLKICFLFSAMVAIVDPNDLGDFGRGLFEDNLCEIVPAQEVLFKRFLLSSTLAVS